MPMMMDHKSKETISTDLNALADAAEKTFMVTGPEVDLQILASAFKRLIAKVGNGKAITLMTQTVLSVNGGRRD